MTKEQREAVATFTFILADAAPSERKEMLDILQQPYCVSCGREESFGNVCQCDNDE